LEKSKKSVYLFLNQANREIKKRQDKKIPPHEKKIRTTIKTGPPISEIYIPPKSKNALDQLIVALKEIYCEYND
jgi:hypothetical protein